MNKTNNKKRIPGIFVETADLKKTESAKSKKKDDTRNNLEYNNYPTDSSRILLWIGVLSISSIIFVMWVWNAGIIFKKVSNSGNGEVSSFFNEAKADIGSIISSVDQDEVNDNNKTKNNNSQEKKDKMDVEDIANILSEISTEIKLNAASSSASSTDSIASSTLSDFEHTSSSLSIN
ncbi:MAG: hypothetical protein GF349_02725 [Candidatus Magasanikbacteria bacterium]|nr:hypothetical protein [Candidatus Magasanikbacteria bacterium]